MEDQKLEKILSKIDNVGDKVDGLVVRMEKTEKQVDRIAVVVVGMQEQLKDMVTKNELQQAKSEILGDVDRFTKLHETLDQELVMLRNKYSRLEDRVVVLEQKLAVA